MSHPQSGSPHSDSLSQRRRWDERYQSGPTPWDTRITPPEVEAFWRSHRLPSHGLALDLGCGPGTNVAYLARLGLRALGVDIALAALLTARARIQDGGAWAERAHFLLADVSRLPLHGVAADYVLDIGCLHGVPPDRRDDYVRGVIRNLRPGGYYQLFAFDRQEESADGEEWRGLGPGEVEERFSPHLTVVEVIQGNPDRRPCRWYLLRRT